MLNAIISIITSRLMWSFLGITAISSIIWFIGPIISIGSVVPFESNTVRIVVIVSLFLIWILIQLVPRLYRAWLNKKLSSQSNKDSDENKQFQSAQYATLSERFSDASRLLKNAYFYGLNTKYKPNWKHFFNRQYLYQLPWYVVIGAPHSGKTTTLANSGLHFPLADHFEKSTLCNMKGMDNCNWWFTNDAVLLDTAGRYTTQDTQHEQDASEWKCFIKLLKKYRTRQPLNGIIITLSVEDLLNPSKDVRDRQAYMLRRRLSELHEQLKIRFPIYVIITKTDLLKGFSAYFSHLDKAQRDQIWGFNFPWSKTGWSMNEVFEQQYSLLQKRLDAELPNILLHQNAPRHCAESYLFPQEFATLRPWIAQYLEIAFAKSGFEIPYSPRGIYFTSGTQKGVPFDSVMEKLNHNLQLPTDNDSSSISWGNNKAWEGNKDFLHQPPVHQVYFLKNLLGSIFQEAGLASYNRWWIYRNRLLNGLGYAILAAILGLIITLFFTSYSNNKNYLMEVQAKIPPILHQGAELKKSTNDIDIYALLPILNNLANLGKSNNFSVDAPPLSYRMGLYCGEQISNASWSLYTKTLQTLLLPQIVQLITFQMRQSGNNNTDNTYRTLKAYQMLYLPKHYDGKFLRNWVMQYLQTHLPSNISQEQLNQINGHLHQLLDNQIVTSPYVRDNQLVEQKQVVLSSIPPAQRIYTHLKHNLLNNIKLSPVNLGILAGPQAELTFSRISGASITLGVPGMFTPVGYQTGIGKNLNSLIDSLYSQDSWILGSYERKQPPKEIAFFVRQFYIDDYIDQWDKFLSDIHLNNIDNLEQRANMARLLSSNLSPMRNLLINISKNVTLDEEPNDSKVGKIGSTLSNNSSSLTDLVSKQLLPDNGQLTPEQILKEHFAQIITLAKSPDGKNKKIPFDSILSQISELYEYLNSVQSAVSMGIPVPSNKIITQLQTTAEHLPIPFKGMISSLAIGASSDTQLSDIKNVSEHLSAEVSSFCNQAIANRYPLTHGTRNDIKPDDMARMFAPKTGIMDSFFQNNLIGKVDTTQSDWRFRPGVDGKTLPGSNNLLKPFKQAQIIRDTFFNTGATPSFRVIVRTVDMDNDILSMILDVDGQRLQYSHGPPVSQLLNWPGPNGTNQVRIQLNLADGTTASLITSGPWALNRLIDLKKYSTMSQNTGNSMGLFATFNISGHDISLEFTPNSIFSPFQLPDFTCPSLINL
ncbi:type VI secretion system membrane subunit TssM [Xenorhabdus lircayensis]|uniref:Type VI secretion system membrane subunit TssM n=1 Tax=Xenorhabdus lircayensis TaxID=2763499 RepID=A0ABS0U914_9GAMM|nr:type VI secretion system membrane subunit TssM [Xenorhabdus lircayensis]MBI6550368.1 type VI secretion system membrane subunit TssM [Xenorhabdus lircayensis]